MTALTTSSGKFLNKVPRSLQERFNRVCEIYSGIIDYSAHYKAISGVDRIISFADRRLDPHVPAGAVEQKAGFVIWDNKNKMRLHRLAASKKNMAKYTDVDGKTQQKIMESLQWFKIPSLGAFKYEL